MAIPAIMDRNLALESVRVTEAAAIAASRWMGRGDEKAADQAAVDAMRQALNGLEIDGIVVIGEGERDEAPMLYIGENGRHRQGAEARHRARSARRHDDHRQGRPQRDGRASPWRSRAASSTRRTSTWTRSRVGGGLPDGIVDIDRSPRKTWTRSPRSRVRASRTWWSAFSTGRGTPS